MKLLLFITILFLSVSCESPLTDAKNKNRMKVEYYTATEITTTSARISWGCSTEEIGVLMYSGGGKANTQVGAFPLKYHSYVIYGLTTDTVYSYQVFCGISGLAFSPFATFVTSPSDELIRKRGIWILGGIGSDSNPISEVDLFDPVTGTWYSSITKIPTPRAFAQIASHNGKIYVMGGLTKSGGSYSPSSITEEFDVYGNTWTTKNSMPSTLQGGLAGSSGDELVVLAGTTTTDMTTGTVLNTVFRFRPDQGTGGTWVSQTSFTAISARVDMSGCMISGTMYFTGGRFYQDGTAQSTSDAYTPATNTTTSVIEASLSLGRHGAGSACYRPKTGDTGASDTPAFLIVGGSTLTNIQQPINTITTSNRYEYYPAGTTNSYTTGTNFPVSVYYPGVEISYEQRKLYVFGGATNLNLPTDSIYSMDLSSPTGNPWVTESTKLPRPRFGHKAVIVNR